MRIGGVSTRECRRRNLAPRVYRWTRTRGISFLCLGYFSEFPRLPRSCAVYRVDAFTSDAFAGTPAAVCHLPEPRPDAWLQDVAGEMNLSETVFLRPHHDGPYRLRWFTPSHEVDLCGHATLASIHVL